MWSVIKKTGKYVCMLSLSVSLIGAVQAAESSQANASKATQLELPKTVQKTNVLTLNINTSDAQTISDLMVGVGPQKAQAIVNYRTEKGEFSTLNDLLAVKGIGPATLEKNKDRIVFK